MDYYTSIEQITNFIIETELTLLCKVDVANVRKLKALLGVLATSVPFEVDISKLATTIGVHRNTVISYLYDMDKAELINMLFSDRSFMMSELLVAAVAKVVDGSRRCATRRDGYGAQTGQRRTQPQTSRQALAPSHAQ